MVRESGRLSFSRIFQAGHGSAAYQPETSFRIFDRTMSRTDVATGKVNLSKKKYATKGPWNIFSVKNAIPEPRLSVCYLLSVPYTCTAEQYGALVEGTATVKNWVVIEPGGSTGAECAQRHAVR